MKLSQLRSKTLSWVYEFSLTLKILSDWTSNNHLFMNVSSLNKNVFTEVIEADKSTFFSRQVYFSA